MFKEMRLDPWQRQVLETKGNICLRSGRQVGKSTVISVKVGKHALYHKNQNVMVIASVERQAALLFEKILAYIHEKNKSAIKTGKDRPTKHKIQLKNGSVIHCLPTGESGYGIRGYTINLLVADEAAFIPEAVWSAVTPMLAITRGNIILLSTPFGREGYFARCFKDDRYTKFHVSSEECPRKDPIFLAHEKERMTKREYAQEYLGEFVDDLMQFFPDQLIIQTQTLSRRNLRVLSPLSRDFFLGVDVARMGEDETTLEIIDRTNRNNLIQKDNITLRNSTLVNTTKQIIALDAKYKFRKIYVDSGGLGIGVCEMLRENAQTRRKIVEINNAQRGIEHNSNRHRTIIKENLYNNLLQLMEKKQIQLLDDPEVFQSLKSVQFEYTDKGDLKIFGRYTHIAEGLIRAAWCNKDKSLKIYIY